nr:rab escort protein 1-like [Coffea arabica]
MDEAMSYPQIEPANFDLIVIGTGLPESILAAAASSSGKTVLHLDPNPYYGSHFASLHLHDFTEFLQTHSLPSAPETQPSSSGEFNVLPLTTSPVYSSIETSVFSPEILQKSNQFNLDLAGPRVLFCADKMIDLFLKTEINHSMEFKSVDASFICEGEEGNLRNVPDSRSAIFKDKSLSFTEKNQLMRFFKLVQDHFGDGSGEESKKISEEDLKSPFVEFLSRKIGLSQKLKSIILYAISMAHYEQDNLEVCKDVLETKDGIDLLILYHKSGGRFPNAPGAMIYPLYGQGELLQAFCRRAAVKGSIHVLRMPVVGLLADKEVGNYKGVKLLSGQELFSHKLILDPSFILPSGFAPSYLYPEPDGGHDFGLLDEKVKVVRGICITKSSLKLDVANCLVFFPPRSLFAEQMTSVRVFQLSSNVAACPSGMFVVYLSTLCKDVGQGKKMVNEAMNALFSIPISGKPEENSTDSHGENTVLRLKPSLLWSTVYIQELTMGAFGCVSSTFMPDGNLQYNNLLDATTKLFHKMYPNEEFFPEATSSIEVAEDGAFEQLDS